MFRRLFSIFLLLIFLTTVSSKVALAQVPGANPAGEIVNLFSDIQDYCTARSGDVVNLETWYSGKCPDKSFFQALFDTATSDTFSASGGFTQRGEFRGFSDIVLLDFITKFLPENPKDTFSFGIADAAIPVLTKTLATIYSNPAASGTQYLAHINKNLNNAKLVKPAYAQQTGLGFQKLLPILPAWEGMRNVAYTLFILVFVVYGFMIMFRAKINPQTVINFQLAIPKLVVTLLAITFSYAIAGLIIDLSVVIPGFIVSVLQNAKVINLEQSTLNTLLGATGITQTNTPINIITGRGIFGGGYLGLQIIYEIIFARGVAQIVSLMTGIPDVVYSIIFFATGASLIITLILILAFFYVLFKIAFMAIQSYAIIVLNIIFAPIILLGNVLPGNDAFGNWIRNLLAHISVFPSIIIMFMLALTFLGDSSPINSGDMWVPPYFLGSAEIEPYSGLNNAKGAGALLAFAIIFLTPKLAEMIRDALKVPAFKYGGALGEALQVGTAGQQYLGGKYEGSSLDRYLGQSGLYRGYRRATGTVSRGAGLAAKGLKPEKPAEGQSQIS